MGLYSEACFYALRGHKGQIVQTGIHAVNIIIMKLLKNPAFVAVLLTSLLLTTNSQITDGLFSENPTGIINCTFIFIQLVILDARKGGFSASLWLPGTLPRQ